MSATKSTREVLDVRDVTRQPLAEKVSKAVGRWLAHWVAVVSNIVTGTMGEVHTSTASGAAVAGAGVSRIPITDGVDVVAITPSSTYETSRQHDADFLCLDGHAFGVKGALAWIQTAKSVARRRNDRPPLFALLADQDLLSEEDLRLATEALAVEGGLFYRYPPDCNDFRSAFSAFAENLRRRYRRPASIMKRSTTAELALFDGVPAAEEEGVSAHTSVSGLA